MIVPFTKAHGAMNDFLLTWEADAPPGGRPALARAICHRHTGVGADGWYLIAPSSPDADASVTLYNADGGVAEISGNGTRCVAAFLLEAGLAGDPVRIRTGAGVKELRLLDRTPDTYTFEVDMGQPRWAEGDLRALLPLQSGGLEVTLLDVGNPQCAVFVADFSLDWRRLGAEIERHPRFPDRTNVSFVKPVDEQTVEVRIFERGVGETMSSGTGSVGAAVAAILRGVARSPVRVLTPAGPLEVRWDDRIHLTGPAQIVARGEFHWRP